MRRSRQSQGGGSSFGPMLEMMAMMQAMQQMGQQEEMFPLQRDMYQEMLDQTRFSTPVQRMSGVVETTKGLNELSSMPGYAEILGANQQYLDQIGIPDTTWPMLTEDEYLQALPGAMKRNPSAIPPEILAKLQNDPRGQAIMLRNMLGGGKKGNPYE